MHYTAIKQNSHHFEVCNERRELVGCLDYAGLVPGKARITINDYDVYNVAAPRYSNSVAGITKNGIAYAELKYNWNDAIIVSFNTGKSFFFVRKSVWERDYAVVDENQYEIAFIKSKFRWNTLSFNYEIDVRGKVLDKEIKLAFPFILIYCTQYVRKNREVTL